MNGIYLQAAEAVAPVEAAAAKEAPAPAEAAPKEPSPPKKGPQPPEFIEVYPETEFTEKATLTLSVKVTGKPVPEVKWFRCVFWPR